MALLLHEYDPNAQSAWVAQAIQTAQRLAIERQKMAEDQRQHDDAMRQASLQEQRRAKEFVSKMGYEQARLALDRQIFASDSAPFSLDGLSGASVAPAARVPALEMPTAPASARGPAVPTAPMIEGTGPAPEVATPMEEGRLFGGTDIDSVIAETAGVNTPPGLPEPEPLANTPDEVALLPPLPANAAEQTPAQRVASTLREFQQQGIPLTQKSVRSALPGMLTSAVASANKAAAAPATNDIGKWPINERGYRFNPQNPEQTFMERHTVKGPTYSQVKTTDPAYGLKPAGEGLFMDDNGGRYFVEKVTKGQPQYKRVEEDMKVTYRAKDAQGRLHSYNQFGAEVSVTPETVSFLTPKSKLMVGSDGAVYAFDEKGTPLQSLPQGVTFDRARATEAARFMVGSDGNVYAFNRAGRPVNDIPDGVRFDRPKDPDVVAKWEVDEKTGDLHGFNHLGEKVSVNEGSYAKSASGGGKEPTMTEQATYEAVAPKIKDMWAVYDEIRAGGLSPQATREELVAALGEARGGALAARRQAAQVAASSINIRGRRMGRDFAEGFVRAFESRQGATTPAAVPVANSPATPPSVSQPTTPKTLTREEAQAILQEAGGDKQKARELARSRGYTL